MAAATNAQVQAFVDQRVRPRCEQIRALVLAMQDDIAALGDIYANLTNNPTWVDNRTDGPPHLLTANDVLAYNTFVNDANTAMSKDVQYPVVLAACVRPVGQTVG